MDRITFNQAAARILGREHEEHGIGTLGEKTLHAIIKNYVEPDISVICDKHKLDDRGCNGAPDWIIEIVSPSTEHMDYGIKLFKYRSAGVREYWIINPRTRIVNVFDFEHDQESAQYSFEDEIPVCIYSDLTLRISDLL